jgi:hypothetical protein
MCPGAACQSKPGSSQTSFLTIRCFPRNQELALTALSSSEKICEIAQVESASGFETDAKCFASDFYSDSLIPILNLSSATLHAILSNDSLRIIDDD